MSSTINASTASGGGVVTTADASGILQLQTGGTTALTIDGSQNVGIGTSSPSRQLFVYTSANSLQIQSVVRNGNTGTGIAAIGFNVADLSEGDYTQAGIGLLRGVVNGSGSLCFYNKGSGTASNFTTADEKMRIDSSGNLLKGVTSAYSTSYGTGEISFATNSAGMVFKCIGASGASVPTVQVFLNGAGTAVGYIAVGASATNFTNLSDYRLKKDVTPISNALNRLSRIKPVSFIWKESGEIGESFIAHELQEECPIAVVGNKDDVNEDGSIRPQGVDASKLIPLLTAAIKELKAIIDTQNARIEALEAK